MHRARETASHDRNQKPVSNSLVSYKQGYRSQAPLPLTSVDLLDIGLDYQTCLGFLKLGTSRHLHDHLGGVDIVLLLHAHDAPAKSLVPLNASTVRLCFKEEALRQDGRSHIVHVLGRHATSKEALAPLAGDRHDLVNFPASLFG